MFPYLPGSSHDNLGESFILATAGMSIWFVGAATDTTDGYNYRYSYFTDFKREYVYNQKRLIQLNTTIRKI